jgi:hypothetical protein
MLELGFRAKENNKSLIKVSHFTSSCLKDGPLEYEALLPLIRANVLAYTVWRFDTSKIKNYLYCREIWSFVIEVINVEGRFRTFLHKTFVMKKEIALL